MKFRLFFLLAVIWLCSGCDDQVKIPAVKNFDPARYCGKWYEIARLPNRFERGMSEVYTIYSPGKNDTLQVFNSGMKDGRAHSVTGVAKLRDDSGDGELEVSFFRPFYGRYRIIKLPPDYSYAVVMGNSPALLWILARTPELPPEKLTEINEFLRLHKFPVEKLIWR